MSALFPNIYDHRKVAEASAKSCDICYKMSTSVLITPDKKDFFYVCAVHLKDRYFCTPKIDEEAVKAKREKELEAEKERVKKEYEEKQKKKKQKEKEKEEKEKNKDQDKKDDKKKDDKTDDDDSDKKDKNDSDDTPMEEEPRTFELKAAFYQQRLQRRRQAEAAKRDREKALQPGYFPSVPTDAPSK
ncbi:hypothetical protein NQ176_g3787 [Zarea fungicola]|uniref:Uncharacterized protein n=1 Tax=Zarea fungicola TaxID=93591 RepID=A0ACC1NJH0_9HYPO|nr:hypothetical protein NQ176_g3787 [Lecanicillium fungicola]